MDSETASSALFVTLFVFAAREFFAWLSKKNLQQGEAKMKEMCDKIQSISKSAEEIASKVENVSQSTKTISDKVQNAIDLADKINLKADSAAQMNKTMYDWHDKSDEDGVKIWYVRRSLEEALQENVRAINILAKNSETQTRLLEDMINQNKEIHKDQIVLSRLLEKLFDKR